MGSKLLGVIAVAAGLAAGGCGGSSASHGATTPNGHTTARGSTTAPPGATGSGSPLDVYLIRSGEEPGYATQPPTDYKSPQAMETALGGYSAADLRRLRSEGFQEAAVENTGTSLGGLSFVFELGSPAAAKRDLAAEVAEDLHAKQPGIRFKVAAIPGAVGVAYPNSAGGGGGGNVLFSEGRCVLLVGDEGDTSSFRQPALAAAAAIWQRTHTHTGACSS